MNEREYLNWEQDVLHCLSVKYSEEEIWQILYWFQNIRSSGERDLIGQKRIDAFQKFFPYNDKWNLYDSMMVRVWVYAPYILEMKE